MGGVPHRRRVRNPQVDLERAVAGAAHRPRPVADLIGGERQGAARAQPARVGDGDRQRRRTGPRHGGQQDGDAQAEAIAESAGAVLEGHGRSHGGLGTASGGHGGATGP